MKIALVLHNIRSTYNVGAILRTAEGLGVEKVICSGYTPRYEDENLLPHLRSKLNHQIEKSAIGAEKLVAQENVEDLQAWLAARKKAGSAIIGLENNLNPEEAKQRLVLGADELPNAQDVVLILGEEVTGIPPAIRRECDFFLEIPMVGRKESFNVSVAAAIALWGVSAPGRK